MHQLFFFKAEITLRSKFVLPTLFQNCTKMMYKKQLKKPKEFFINLT